MGLHTTEAIVLRRYPFRETSVIVSCLTEEFGKVKGLVKGLRAQPNRYRSPMEPLTVNRIVFYDTHTSQLHLISQCDLVAALTELQRDLETTKVAAFCVELADTIVAGEEPQPALYHLLRQTLQQLAQGTNAPEALQAHRLHYIVRLLRVAGFQPQLGACTSCQTEVMTTGYWSARHGGLLCQRCLHEDPRAEIATPEMLRMLQTLAEADYPPAMESRLLAALRLRLDVFLRWRLDRPLKTLVA